MSFDIASTPASPLKPYVCKACGSCTSHGSAAVAGRDWTKAREEHTTTCKWVAKYAGYR